VSAQSVRFLAWDAAAPPAERRFAAERAKILAAWPGAIVEHVGGTAVPGCLTKGDLDIQVRVPEADFDTAVAALESLYSPDPHNPASSGIASFADPEGRPPLGVHVTMIKGPEDHFHALRDLLVARPDLAAALNDLKRSFEGRSMDEYRDAKAAWIARISGEHGIVAHRGA
jgi:GrpB-like predicted nucleotidyltransferase (UPF0157 family)